jgi:hypothetical protein
MPTLTPHDPALKQVTLGFAGGPTVTRRMTAEHLEALRSALDGDAAWHELRTEHEVLVISLSRLAFLELDEAGRRLGFG